MVIKCRQLICITIQIKTKFKITIQSLNSYHNSQMPISKILTQTHLMSAFSSYDS